jgi:hypothetical protein
MNKELESFIDTLNDAKWSSNIARGKGMKNLAALSLDTNTNFNTQYFVVQLAIKTINTLLPIVLRYEGLETNAVECEQATTLEQAKQAAYNASYAARAAGSYVAGYAASYAFGASAYYEYPASYAAEYASRVIGGDGMLLLSAKIAEDILIDMGVEGTK